MHMVYATSLEQSGSKEVLRKVMARLSSDQIIELISAMMHPKKLAIIKCQAHKKGKDFVIKGNNAADQYAKQAYGCTIAIMAPSVLI